MKYHPSFHSFFKAATTYPDYSVSACKINAPQDGNHSDKTVQQTNNPKLTNIKT
jgi:hypothetical protein